MKNSLFLFLLFFLTGSLSAQQLADYQLVVEEVSFEGLPGLQSFAWGQHDGKWLIIGGRTDGLHRRQPWASFWEEDNNQYAFVIDPAQKAVWSASLSELPVLIYEQLQSTNMEFKQVGETLYIFGGYGYAASVDRHITHPSLTVVDVTGVMEAVIKGESLTSFFRQVQDDRLQVTGGYLGYLNDYFYLVGGQKFMGLYNPMGPDHGPGFVQEYTNQIRKFRVEEEEGQLNITDFSAQTDSLELHRRDYNLSPQVFPDRSLGFTAFSGVFQYKVNLPWLNTVDVFEDKYTAQHDFNQYLNQYHTAHLSAYDWGKNIMHTVFFGGISRYYLDESGQLIDDQNVPFVKTISLVERNDQWQMNEQKIGDMPALLGTGAEFIPNPGMALYENGVIKLDVLSGENIVLGHIFGGIESSQSNIFFINTGDQSVASNRLFSVRLVKGNTTGTTDEDQSLLHLNVFPNPSRDGHFMVEFELRQKTTLTIDLLNTYGSILRSEMVNQTHPPGKHQLRLRLHKNAPGLYYLRVYDGTTIQTRKILRQ